MNKFSMIMLMAFLSACSGLYNLRAPEVSVADVKFSDGNISEQRFKLTLRVTNPNERDIVIDGLTFDVLVDEKSFAHGISNTPTVLPKLGEAEMDVEGTAQSFDIIRKLLELKASGGRLPYRIRGEVMTRDYGRIPFDHKSEAALPGALRQKDGI
ncbi:MAG TPA: LEA type 2 family protein [Rhodocyclaceae bacterium]|nr:LEA type 2 family protein [Rhodocyclaceae bacterium]